MKRKKLKKRKKIVLIKKVEKLVPKTLIMWVAINRSEDRANGYGQSLMDEIARPNQWQGYDSAAPYSDETYAIAKQVLETKAKGGLRPIDSDMLWFVLNDDGYTGINNC